MKRKTWPKPNGKTLSLIAGTTVCQAKCPFCISKATPFQGMGPRLEKIDRERLEKACSLAKEFGIENAMITGKGEPALYPEHIEEYLGIVGKYGFDSVEMQTNALALGNNPKKYDPLLRKWRDMGLKLIAISVVHYERDRNGQIYTANQGYIDLPAVIEKLHKLEYKVRLSCTLIKGYVDSVEEMKKMVLFAHENGVEQLTLRRMEAVENSNCMIYAWTKPRVVDKGVVEEIHDELEKNGRKISEFFYGAGLYEYGETRQNVCLTTGLTDKKEGGDGIRQLIFFPSGKIITDWRYDAETEGQPIEINGVKIE
jgi:molybdenum cofactor biosynthesis enzyme MoaA